jgi:hypothetical protein
VINIQSADAEHAAADRRATGRPRGPADAFAGSDCVLSLHNARRLGARTCSHCPRKARRDRERRGRRRCRHTSYFSCSGRSVVLAPAFDVPLSTFARCGLLAVLFLRRPFTLHRYTVYSVLARAATHTSRSTPNVPLARDSPQFVVPSRRPPAHGNVMNLLYNENITDPKAP